MRMSFKSYVSLIILVTVSASFSIGSLTAATLHLLMHVEVIRSILFGLGGGLLAGASTTILLYIYPFYKSDKIKRELDNNMAFSTSYMAILARSSVPPDRIFRSISKIHQELAIVKESRVIMRDIELFGVDIITALENASKRATSERFRELLEGFIATIRTGGQLRSYLLDKAKESIQHKRITLRKFSDTLSILSEFYVTLLVAGPLIFVVILAVMAMLGGYGFGLLNPTLLLRLLTYVAIPIGSVVFLIIIDALSPR